MGVKVYLLFLFKFVGFLIGKKVLNFYYIKNFSGVYKVYVFFKDRDVFERYVEIIGIFL